MSCSVDFTARRITASPGMIAGEASGRTIGLAGRGLARLQIGSELHRVVQAEIGAKDEGFRAEVGLETCFETDGWVLEISGRADGVSYRGDLPDRVDEIKTLHFAVDLGSLYSGEILKPFKRQLGIYAWMLYRIHGVRPGARLILVDVVGREQRIDEIQWFPEAVEADLRKFVHRVVGAEKKRMARIEELRRRAGTIPFPHETIRPFQEEIALDVGAALDSGKTLMLQAATGTGKTAAVLHPALRWALAHGKRLFFVTAKTLQQRLVVETARKMQDAGVFRSLQLRAKSKMCANEEMICHEEYCPWAEEYSRKMLRAGVMEHLLETSLHQEPGRIYDVAFHHEVCPFEVSLELLGESDLVTCDYNYVFDPSIGLDALLGEGGLEEVVLVIDEGHNLVSRSREYYSPELTLGGIDAALSVLERKSNKVFEKLGELCRDLKVEVEGRIAAAAGNAVSKEAVIDLDPVDFSSLRMKFDSAVLEYFFYKKEQGLFSAEDPVVEIFLALNRFHRVLELSGDEFVYLARRGGEGGDGLRIFCRDASRFLGEVFSRCAGAVVMSATLEPFEFYENLLGTGETIRRVFGSPFPGENRLILNIAGIDTTYRRRAEYHDAVAGWIRRLAPEDGNTLVLFPSYAYLDEVASRLPAVPDPGDKGRALRLTIQSPGLGDELQDEVLEALKSPEPRIVMAVLGGIFAEGIDYPGSMLSEVIIVSPALPRFNAEQELLRAFFQQRYGHGFSYAYLIPGMTRVIQAAGRLIRSAEDRGVIVLIGRRFQDSRHARYLPAEWMDGDPSSLLSEDPEFMVRRFFSES